MITNIYLKWPVFRCAESEAAWECQISLSLSVNNREIVDNSRFTLFADLLLKLI